MDVTFLGKDASSAGTVVTICARSLSLQQTTVLLQGRTTSPEARVCRLRRLGVFFWCKTYVRFTRCWWRELP